MKNKAKYCLAACLFYLSFCSCTKVNFPKTVKYSHVQGAVYDNSHLNTPIKNKKIILYSQSPYYTGWVLGGPPSYAYWPLDSTITDSTGAFSLSFPDTVKGTDFQFSCPELPESWIFPLFKDIPNSVTLFLGTFQYTFITRLSILNNTHPPLEILPADNVAFLREIDINATNTDTTIVVSAPYSSTYNNLYQYILNDTTHSYFTDFNAPMHDTTYLHFTIDASTF